MPKKKVVEKKKSPAAQEKAKIITPTPYGKTIKKAKKTKVPKSQNPLFEARPKNFGIGGDIQPRRDLTRFVRWPKYIKLQRQRRILMKRLKVPPFIHQFQKTLDKHSAAGLFNLLEKYSPETKHQRKEREIKKAKGDALPDDKKPKILKYGLGQVTGLVEKGHPKLVIIAHDIDPIELVIWLPTLCRKKGVPFVVVKGKARLGKIVNKKTCTCIAVTEVEPGKDAKDLAVYVEKATQNFNDRHIPYLAIRNTELLKTGAYGGGIMGSKHLAKKDKEEKRRLREEKKKRGDTK